MSMDCVVAQGGQKKVFKQTDGNPILGCIYLEKRLGVPSGQLLKAS